MKRFLFVFSDTGGGHRSAARAVQAEMVRQYGANVEVKLVDFFKAVERWPFPRVPYWYPKMVKLGGVPWAMGFWLTNSRPLSRFCTRLTWPYVVSEFNQMLRENPADVIVSFHPVVNDALHLAQERLGLDTPLMTVAQDLVTIHVSTFAPGYDLYIVPTQQARCRAIRAGVPSQLVKAMGVPTRRDFARVMYVDQKQARAELGLPRQGYSVLFIGGGEGMGPLNAVITAVLQHGRLQQLPEPLQLVVVTGRNQTLYRRLSNVRSSVPLSVQGFVDDLGLWMRAADVIVTKAGPNTLSESFIAGRPVVLYNAIPGQETGNVQYVVENEAGVWAPRPAKAAAALETLLKDSERRAYMTRQARKLARPHAARKIAQQIWSL